MSQALIFKPEPAPLQDTAVRKNLLGLDLEELKAEFAAIGEPAFRAKQLWQWMYEKGAGDFAVMTNLSKSLREKLETQYSVARPEIVKDLTSVDGTRKWLIKFGINQEVETVYIPEEDRGTLCVSSQVGCTLSCTFCHTGTQPWVKNLSAYDIVSQLLIARDALNEWPSSKTDRRITNIVFMGMGEPLLNYDNVAKAIKLLLDTDGICMSRRKITLSTSGVVPKIVQCGEDLRVNLAISLHAVRDELRDVLVPINRRYPISELMQACRNYPPLSNAQRITWEYVMLKGVNDSEADARELVRLIRGIPSKVNLIPFNPWPGSSYECSSAAEIKKFADIIYDAGYASPVRSPRGQDILAACGQLKSESIRESRIRNQDNLAASIEAI